jgi:hypothetical protein
MTTGQVRARCRVRWHVQNASDDERDAYLPWATPPPRADALNGHCNSVAPMMRDVFGQRAETQAAK